MTYGCYADPAREHEPGVFKATGTREHGHGQIRIDGVDCEQTDNGRLGSVVDEPVGELVGLQGLTCQFVARWHVTDHRDMRQSVKKKERYPQAKHYM